MKIVATTSFASSRLPERRQLERRTLAPIVVVLRCPMSFQVSLTVELDLIYFYWDNHLIYMGFKKTKTI